MASVSMADDVIGGAIRDRGQWVAEDKLEALLQRPSNVRR